MSNENDVVVVGRRVRLSNYGPHNFVGYMAEVLLDKKFKPDSSQPQMMQEKVGQYAFIRVDGVLDRLGIDHLKGEAPDEKAVMYVGNSFGRNYYTSKSLDSVPVDVFEKLRNKGLTLYENVGGGWEYWNGRPEFSENYIDFSEARTVDLDALIEERRDD